MEKSGQSHNNRQIFFQDVQEKCYQEISNVLGDTDLSLEHIHDLNYCQAVLAEIQRHGQVAVTSVMHRITVQVDLDTAHCYYLIINSLILVSTSLWIYFT